MYSIFLVYTVKRQHKVGYAHQYAIMIVFYLYCKTVGDIAVATT